MKVLSVLLLLGELCNAIYKLKYQLNKNKLRCHKKARSFVKKIIRGIVFTELGIKVLKILLKNNIANMRYS